jgi:hypothetical protein
MKKLSLLRFVEVIKDRIIFFLFNDKTPEDFKQEMEKLFSEVIVTNKVLIDKGPDAEDQIKIAAQNTMKIKQNQVESLTAAFNFLYNYKLEKILNFAELAFDQKAEEEFADRFYAMILCAPIVSFSMRSSRFIDNIDDIKEIIFSCSDKISNASLSEINTYNKVEEIVVKELQLKYPEEFLKN